jgi:AcrR family transcriptional regulator
MCPRQRTIPDSDVISAAARVVATRGAANTRLTDISAASGIAPATLLQRYGSREALMATVGETYVADLQQVMATHSPHLESLQSSLFQLPAALHMAFFNVHPQQAGRYSIELRKHIAFALFAAVQAGEIAPCDTAGLARDLQLAYFGMLTAAFLENTQLNPEDLATLFQTHLSSHM